MVSLLQKSFLVVLLGQVVLSLLNTEFTLPDANAVISIFGFYGAIRSHRQALLVYILLAGVSTAMDIVRLFLWNAYIQSKVVPYYTILGNYYTALLGFGMVIKVVGSLFAVFVYRTIQPSAPGTRNSVAAAIINNEKTGLLSPQLSFTSPGPASPVM